MSRDSKTSEAAAVGKRLAEAARRCNLNHKKAAEKLGMADQTWRNMVTGAGTTQFVKLAQICRTLHTTPNDILGFSRRDDDAPLRGAIETVLLGLGHPEATAQFLATTILEASQSPLLPGSGLDPVSGARAQAALALKQALGSK